jgi:hypothetical protein
VAGQSVALVSTQAFPNTLWATDSCILLCQVPLLSFLLPCSPCCPPGEAAPTPAPARSRSSTQPQCCRLGRYQSRGFVKHLCPTMISHLGCTRPEGDGPRVYDIQTDGNRIPAPADTGAALRGLVEQPRPPPEPPPAWPRPARPAERPTPTEPLVVCDNGLPLDSKSASGPRKSLTK